MHKYDVAIIGCGVAGMSTALRLQAAGLSTVVLESHGQPGGCAGYYSKKGFNFDVGATTLVDFERGGIGDELLRSTGLSMPDADLLDYQLWLPDRLIYMYHDKNLWHKERLIKFGDSPAHQQFWKLIDNLADVFWRASRKGLKLPFQNVGDIWKAVRILGVANLFQIKYLNKSMEDALKKHGLENDAALKAALAMLVEDTVNSTLANAPLINAALGITIRGAGLHRAKGGMKGFWDHIVHHYKQNGGDLLVGQKVENISLDGLHYTIKTRKKTFCADKIVSAIPAESTMAITTSPIKERLGFYVDRDKGNYESAIVVFLGVPDSEVSNQALTHHQLLYDYDLPLGDGNNMFISVSSAGDTDSAPAGYRSVMISTHCKIADWKDLSDEEYLIKKELLGQHLLMLARKVYPDLGKNAMIFEIGTPKTYRNYTGRVNGNVGGVRQNLKNSNFKAMPHDIGVKKFRMVGDSTWPGLGTVACILGSRIVTEQLLNEK